MNSIFYDLETTGLDPEFDQILQFASVTVDEHFNVVAEHEFRARLRPDVIPNPEALLVTGFDPTRLTTEGLSDYETLILIFQVVNQRPSRLIGYNSDAFDDKFLRWGFYRNLLDPYGHTWRNEAHTADLFSLVVFCSVFKPEALAWELWDDGRKNLRLESLMRANQLADAKQAHDAIVDVRATVELARRIRAFSPSLYDRFLRRTQGYNEKSELGNIWNREILLVGRQFGREKQYQAVSRLLFSEKKQCVFLNLSQIPLHCVSDLKEVPFIFKRWGDQTIAISNPDICTLPEAHAELTRSNIAFLQQNPDFLTWIKGEGKPHPVIRENLDPDSMLYLEFPPFDQPLYIRFHETVQKEELIAQMPEPYRTLAQRIGWRSFDDSTTKGRIDPTQTNTKGTLRFSKENAVSFLRQIPHDSRWEKATIERLLKWYEAR